MVSAEMDAKRHCGHCGPSGVTTMEPPHCEQAGEWDGAGGGWGTRVWWIEFPREESWR